jgi:pantetheine-phosphate adenylyltransferase
MTRTALFPGSFDPVTLGHINIIERGLLVFDRIIIGIGNNADKKYMFPLDKRESWIKEHFKDNSSVQVMSYSGLTVDFAKDTGAGFIIRGLRTSADFEFERAIAHMNKTINSEIETVFILSEVSYSALSSSIVRDIHRNGGEISNYVPSSVMI